MPTMTFSGLRSRKMMLREWTCSSASVSSAAYTATHDSGSAPLASMSEKRSPPPT